MSAVVTEWSQAKAEQAILGDTGQHAIRYIPVQGDIPAQTDTGQHCPGMTGGKEVGSSNLLSPTHNGACLNELTRASLGAALGLLGVSVSSRRPRSTRTMPCLTGL